MVQSGFDRTVLQPDWRRGQNRVLEMTEMEERWVVGRERRRRGGTRLCRTLLGEGRGRRRKNGEAKLR